MTRLPSKCDRQAEFVVCRIYDQIFELIMEMQAERETFYRIRGDVIRRNEVNDINWKMEMCSLKQSVDVHGTWNEALSR